MLKKKGIKAGAMKPVETGCYIRQRTNGERENDRLVPADGMFLREVAGMDEPVELIAPVRFVHPLAPIAPLKSRNRPYVDINSILNAFDVLAAKYEFLIIEGAGGLMVPVMRKNAGPMSPKKAK